MPAPGTAPGASGPHDALLPADHAPTTIERTVRGNAERDLRAVLGDAAYESAYAEGGGLSPEEAAALV